MRAPFRSRALRSHRGSGPGAFRKSKTGPAIGRFVDTGKTTTFYKAAHRQTQVRRVLLRVKDGPDQGTQLRLARPRITVGRSAVNDLTLIDSSVSGTHLELSLSDKEGVLVRDLGSTNGTKVNGVRIKEAWIEPGTTIALGKTVIVFMSADQVAVPVSDQEQYGALWGASLAMRELFATLEKIAATNMSVQIHGETGTGKELVARALHDESDRADKPFVVLDCGSMPRDLAEAAIFGHRRGSFTGAVSDRAGAFEEANGGTLFLDEIGELPLDLQPKLLRVLDRHEVQRIGEHTTRKIDVRVICATHRDLRKMVGQGTFREDLYFRLSVMSVELPPLRDRGDDVILLAERFLSDFNRRQSRQLVLGDQAKAALVSEPWQGNVRQLRNCIERAAYLANTDIVQPVDLHLGRRGEVALPTSAPREESQTESAGDGLPGFDPAIFDAPFKAAKQTVVDQFERAYLAKLVDRAGGNLSRASAEAGITRYYLRELLKRLGMHGKKEPTQPPEVAS